MLEMAFEERFDSAVNDLQTTLERGLPTATAHVETAISYLTKAAAELCRAAGNVEGTPEDDRLVSLSMSIEELEDQVNKQLERMNNL